jgi:hypothetical protein
MVQLQHLHQLATGHRQSLDRSIAPHPKVFRHRRSTRIEQSKLPLLDGIAAHANVEQVRVVAPALGSFYEGNEVINPKCSVTICLPTLTSQAEYATKAKLISQPGFERWIVNVAAWAVSAFVRA